MHPLTLDFRRGPRRAWTGIVILVAGMAGAGLVAHQFRDQLDEQARLESGARKAAAAARRNAVAPRAAVDAQRVALEVRHARKLLVQMSAPWSDMFASLEAARAPDVALLAIESDAERQSVKINAEAKDIRAMLAYLRNLEVRPEFGEVVLQSHEIQAQDAQHPVRFVLGATWRTPN